MKRTILVAEHISFLRIAILDFLKVFNYSCIVAIDGEDAINKAKREQPDVILMDADMPKINGIDATRKILQENKDMKIIVCTYESTATMVLEAMKAGAVDFLAKPIKTDSLLEKIDNIFQNDTSKNKKSKN